MILPLLVLSIGAVLAGWAFVEKFVGEERGEFWKGAIFNAVERRAVGYYSYGYYEYKSAKDKQQEA